jgi:hypothetical protein
MRRQTDFLGFHDDLIDRSTQFRFGEPFDQEVRAKRSAPTRCGVSVSLIDDVADLHHIDL